MNSIHRAILAVIHRLCKHPDVDVVADLNEGDIYASNGIRWYRICGAVRRFDGPWEIAVSPYPIWRRRHKKSKSHKEFLMSMGASEVDAIAMAAKADKALS